MASFFARAASFLGKVADKFPILRKVGDWIGSDSIKSVLNTVGGKAIDWIGDKVEGLVGKATDFLFNKGVQISPVTNDMSKAMISSAMIEAKTMLNKRLNNGYIGGDPTKIMKTDLFPPRNYQAPGAIPGQE